MHIFIISMVLFAPFLSVAAMSSPKRHHGQNRSWAGVNSFFLHAFPESDRLEVLDAIKAADLKVLRLFISETFKNFKNTGSVYMPDIEPKQVGQFDDTQLAAIDQLMVEAHERDIKLTIALHDRYQLGCWGNDSYVDKYDLPALDCSYGKASDNDVTAWYTNPKSVSDFDNRIAHVLEHSNPLIKGAPKWKDLSDHIFSFNIQNEGQGHLDNNTAPVPEWWCDRAKSMRKIMGHSDVLISTGGGNEFPNSDIPENWACDALDVVSLHSYSGVEEFKTKGPLALQRALAADKLMLFEEFGATGENKAQVLRDHIAVFNGLGVPWMPWQISKPGNGAKDFEFWTDEPAYGAVKQGALQAGKAKSAQKWSISASEKRQI